MTLAAILEQAGLAPVAPAVSRQAGAAPALTLQRVPVAPAVPVQKQEGVAETADPLHAIRVHLLALAAAEGMDAAHVHRLRDADLAACIGLDARQLAAYLGMLRDTADRRAGRVPLDDTAAIHCEQCGPIWVNPDIAEVLPVVGGWPRALGCPWCFVRKAGGYIPRPCVTCEGCRHFAPDTLNPEAGMGTCGAGKGMHWPMARHICGNHSTRNPHDQA
ncbi:hypothetical protein [Rhodanobacter umsongensis]